MTVCWTCGKRLHEAMEAYDAQTRAHTPLELQRDGVVRAILGGLGVSRYCCRRTLMASQDLNEHPEDATREACRASAHALHTTTN